MGPLGSGHLFSDHALNVSEAFVDLVHVAVEAAEGGAAVLRFLGQQVLLRDHFDVRDLGEKGRFLNETGSQ